MNWIFKDPPHLFAKFYQKYLNVSEPMAAVLLNRKITASNYDKLMKTPGSFIEPASSLPNIDKVAKAIINLMTKDYHITVFSDYDVDGLTSGYVLYHFLRGFDKDVDVYYPERTEGYGLNMDFCKKVVSAHREKGGKKQAVITTDNGISQIKEILFLTANNVPVIVTDHHEPANGVPNCPYVDPYADSNGHGLHLAGVAVAWKVCCQIAEELGLEDGEAELNHYLPFVAIGTIADVMPMTMENIALVNMGIEIINKKKPEPFATLMKHLGIKKLTAEDIAWKVAPKLNAAGRMGNIKLAGSIFIEQNKEGNLTDNVIELLSTDDKRKRDTDKAVKEASKQNYENDTICLFDASKYPGGIIGIIAGKLSDEFNKPAFVYTSIGDDKCSASARSIKGLGILPFLEKQKEQGNIVGYGGHSEACGLTLVESRLSHFKESMNELILSAIEAGDIKLEEDSIIIDYEIYFNDISKKLLDNITTLPYDKAGFPEPVFIIRNVKVKATEPYSKKEHLVLECTDSKGGKHTIVAWNSRHMYDEIGCPDIVDIAGTIGEVGFPDRTTKRRADDITIMLKAIRPSK